MMSFQRTFLPVALALLACGKGDSGKAATVDLFGKTPVPPGELARVKPGMTQAEVKALFPGIKPTPNHSGSPSLSIDSGYSNVEYRIGFYSDKDAVASLRVQVPKALGDELPKVWGPPAKESRMFPTWTNNEQGYDVTVMDMGRRTSVEYTPFVALTPEYFGSKPGAIDALTKVKLGMTREEITKAVPGLEGAPKGGGSYIPLDGKPKGVTLSASFDDADKAERFVVRLPERGEELVVRAWGPRPGTTRGLGSPMHCWDTADGIRVELADNQLTYNRPEQSVCEVK